MSDPAPGAGSPPRLWLPPVLVLVVTGASWWIFNHSSRAVAERIIAVYFVSLVFGPSVVYPWMRARGASGRVALLGALVVPFAWLVKEGYRITANFSVAESFYYALNPMAHGLYMGIAVQLALWEIAIRRKRAGRWQLRQLGGAPAIALVAVAAYIMFTRWVTSTYGAAEVFYSYVALHARLFVD